MTSRPSSLRDYVQHLDDCCAPYCRDCGQIESADHSHDDIPFTVAVGFAAQPCTCGLAALLALDGTTYPHVYAAGEPSVPKMLVKPEGTPFSPDREYALDGTTPQCTCDSGLGNDPHKSHCKQSPLALPVIAPQESERSPELGIGERLHAGTAAIAAEWWQHVVRIAELSGVKQPGVLRHSVPIEITEGSSLPVIAPQEDGDETSCPKRDDKQHCNCWYDGEACCACGDKAVNMKSANCSVGEHAHCSGIFKTADDDNLDRTWQCACSCHQSTLPVIAERETARHHPACDPGYGPRNYRCHPDCQFAERETEKGEL